MITLFSSFLVSFSLFVLPLLARTHHLTSGNNESDRLALLEFKSGITHDPLGALDSWNNSIHFCNWYGVTCGHRHQRVKVLDLSSHKLAGFISPQVGNLTFLKNLTIQNNSLSGKIPPELGRLQRLQYLRLGNNSLVGAIPANLSSCRDLVGISLAYNSLSQSIPPEIGSLINLRILIFGNNNLTGDIPSSFGNLSSLEILDLESNHVSGRIPYTLGQLRDLTWLEFGVNDLQGTVPVSIFNLSSMENFGVSENRLHGSLPSELGFLFPNLQYLGIFENHFTGSIPPSISNASNVNALYLFSNKLTGRVPNLGNLPQLTWLVIAINQLGSAREGDLEFLSSLTNNTNLVKIHAGGNNFGGTLPASVTNLSSSLREFGLERNQIVGKLAISFENLPNLELLSLWGNRLSGGIPEDIGKLHRLQELDLSDNNFTGKIPSSIGNLVMFIHLYLSANRLEGEIPSMIGKCQSLLSLDISDNDLNGSIPLEVFTISSLSITLNLSRNEFTGALPLEVGNLKRLGMLDISHNMFTGEIPNSLGDCQSLEELAMGENFFRGKIPPSFASLRGLKSLNLSHNNMSDQIPSFLQSFHLEILDLSFNNFSGILPSGGIFENASVILLQGNNMLCGGTAELHLPICTSRKPHARRLIRKQKIIIAIVFTSLAILLAFSILFLWISKKKSREVVISSSENLMLQVSHQSLFDATEGFSARNLIGKGSFSSVYKGSLDLQGIVAVKVFNLQRRGASRSFLVECEALRNIRHRNLVKVITVCSSIDFHGDEFKALVYELMVNGNLDEWLHHSRGTTRKLNFFQRLNISIDVACALNYLHREHCQTPIVHCDLKPTNILLDEEMMAKVGDFGLMKFLSEEINHLSASSSGVRGTVGYAAPEYGMGSDVSSNGDMYSFGILLLEMFTGKRPTDGMFDSSMNLHNYVKIALPEKVTDITDSGLFERGQDDAGSGEKDIESLVAIYEIGIACSQEMPRERMGIRDALAKLIVIRENQNLKVPRNEV